MWGSSTHSPLQRAAQLIDQRQSDDVLALGSISVTPELCPDNHAARELLLHELKSLKAISERVFVKQLCCRCAMEMT